jgi:hypothetical protein
MEVMDEQMHQGGIRDVEALQVAKVIMIGTH